MSNVSTFIDHDWHPYIRYVVSTLNEDPSEDNALEKREADMRQKIQDIVLCDAKSEEKFLEVQPGTTFDVIQVNLCFEATAESIEEYYEAYKKLRNLLNPGGYIVCVVAMRCGWWTSAGTGVKYHVLHLTEEDVKNSLERAGMIT